MVNFVVLSLFSVIFMTNCYGTEPNGLGPDPATPIIMSCVHNDSQKEYTSVTFGEVNSRNVKKEIISSLVGNIRKNVNIYFLGFESVLNSFSGTMFKISKGLVTKYNTIGCVVSYQYLDDNAFKYAQYWNTVHYRLPRITEMAFNVLIEIIDHLQISPNKVSLNGFSLGCNVVKLVCDKGIQHYNGIKFGAVIVTDPVKVGFSPEDYITKDIALSVVIIRISEMSYKEPYGHVDIIENSLNQPGCNNRICSHLKGSPLYITIGLENGLVYGVPSDKNGRLVAFK